MAIGLVVPTLGEPDRMEMLKEAVASIRQQAGVEVQLVVVTIPTKVGDLAKMLSEVPVIAQDGRGIVDAVNSGWLAIGPEVGYLAWLGDDDRLVPGAMRACELALEANCEAAMVYGRCRYIAYDGSWLREIRPGRIALPLLRLGTNLIAQPGAVYRRTALVARGGLNRDLRLAFDVDLHMRLSKDGVAIYVPRVLGEARVHQASLTTSQRERSFAELEGVAVRALGPLSLRTRPVWRPAVHLVGRLAYKISSRLPAPSGGGV
jgi:glycosyltransferase involved in cell wall biosynthesis